ncbi:class I SAM-dependent methyltransferase [Streptomonospora sp. S1-112]|uniref:Class I SAM-dependent methyltransferase n=1 Tax=Streptomonospora mangrovi TaxID=2883123 RepID=A0A9X3NGR0_9ACTN|nr:class I SAM-dependent methyltransferase [Streptomonospora mangrovi]MDA0563404.1 class I SAM-dependent methyltransferase [Streptomonospora mangrovi]
MVTLPSQGGSALPPAHQARDMAQSFGSDAERYDRARPAYPPALISAVVAASPGPDVLDVGIGTGIAARQFAAAGCRVLGVEVDERMAAWARRRGQEVEVAAFEDWDAAGRTFDAVVAAQTWHWIDPAAGAAKAARVLRPGGRLAVFWNAERPPEDLAAAFTRVYARLLPDSPLARRHAGGGDYGPLCDAAAQGMDTSGAFGEVQRWSFPWERRYTRQEYLDLLPTSGVLARLPEPERRPVLEAVGAAIDAAGGAFTMGYTAQVATAARTPAP